MSFDRRPYNKTFKYEWIDANCLLDITTESSTTAHNEAMYGGRVSVEFSLLDKLRLLRPPLTTPPFVVVRERNLSPAVRAKWVEDFSTFTTRPELTVAWSGISSILASTPRLPPNARKFLERKIHVVARDAVTKAVFLEHRTMWVVINIDMLTDEECTELDELEEDEVNESMDDALNESMEEEVFGKRGLSMEAIGRFLKVECFGGEPKKCMVCLDEMVRGLEIARVPCNHLFHPGCIARWLEASNVCPVCRFVVPGL